MSIFKKQPDDNWLIDLDKYRIKEKPQGKWNCEGPWYSDDGEDGVLVYLFEYINNTNNFAVDIGSAHGYGGSHVRHLVDKYDWGSTEMDGSWRVSRKNLNLNYGKNFKWERIHPQVKKEWITPDNICELLDKYKTPKEFNLLSLDIDSMDWYVLEKLLKGGFKPSVAIVEFNPIFEYDESYVINYDSDYKKDMSYHYGASARAFEILMNKYKYTLVHVFPQKTASNLLFILNDYILPTMEINTLHDMHPHGFIVSNKQIGKSRNKPKLENLDKNTLIKEHFKKIKL